MNYSWKQWKRGLLVSVITGLCTGVAGLAIGITWKQAGYLVAGTIAKDILLYLNQHPVDSIQDTSFFTKPPVSNSAPTEPTKP